MCVYASHEIRLEHNPKVNVFLHHHSQHLLKPLILTIAYSMPSKVDIHSVFLLSPYLPSPYPCGYSSAHKPTHVPYQSAVEIPNRLTTAPVFPKMQPPIPATPPYNHKILQIYSPKFYSFHCVTGINYAVCLSIIVRVA